MERCGKIRLQRNEGESAREGSQEGGALSTGEGAKRGQVVGNGPECTQQQATTAALGRVHGDGRRLTRSRHVELVR